MPIPRSSPVKCPLCGGPTHPRLTKWGEVVHFCPACALGFAEDCDLLLDPQKAQAYRKKKGIERDPSRTG